MGTNNKTPKQKATDIAYVCDLVSEKHRLKLKYATKFDKQIKEIEKQKREYLTRKNKELNDLVSEKCKELNIKENHIKRLLKSE